MEQCDKRPADRAMQNLWMSWEALWPQEIGSVAAGFWKDAGSLFERRRHGGDGWVGDR